MLDTENIQIYEGKSMADLIKKTEKSMDERSKVIEDLIKRLSNMVEDVDKAMILMPLIKDYLEIDVKNHKQNLELIAIMERLAKTVMKEGDEGAGFGSSGMLDNDDKDALREIANKMSYNDDDDEEIDDSDLLDDSDEDFEQLRKKAEEGIEKLK